MADRILASAVEPGNKGTQSQAHLQFYVIYTGVQATASAMRAAGTLAKGLNAQMILLAALEVPPPLALQEPPVSIAFMEDQLRELAMQAEIPGQVELRLCRDRVQAIRQALPSGAIVVMAGKVGWRHRGPRKFAATLMRDGHKVFFVEESGKS